MTSTEMSTSGLKEEKTLKVEVQQAAECDEHNTSLVDNNALDNTVGSVEDSKGFTFPEDNGQAGIDVNSQMTSEVQNSHGDTEIDSINVTQVDASVENEQTADGCNNSMGLGLTNNNDSKTEILKSITDHQTIVVHTNENKESSEDDRNEIETDGRNIELMTGENESQQESLKCADGDKLMIDRPGKVEMMDEELKPTTITASTNDNDKIADDLTPREIVNQEPSTMQSSQSDGDAKASDNKSTYLTLDTDQPKPDTVHDLSTTREVPESPDEASLDSVVDQNLKFETIQDRSTDEESSSAPEAEVVVVVEKGLRPKPQIGLLGAVAFGMGSIIGSGIFISPKGSLKETGSVGMSLMVWLAGGFISIIWGLVYGELGTLVPRSGGDFTYIRAGVGEVPAFLTVWIIPFFSNTAAFGVLSLVFADYLCAPIFGDCPPPDVLRKIIGATMMLTLCVVNCYSIKFAANSQIFFTFTKVTALATISVGGIYYLAQGKTENFNDPFAGSSTDVTSYTLALYSSLFAYTGFMHIVEITEELIDHKRNIPRAVIISVVGVTIIYLLTNVSYSVLLTKEEFLSSKAVAYDWGLKGMNSVAIIIPLSVLGSVYGSSNGKGFVMGRIMFAAARAGHLPEVFSYLHVRSTIPVVSVAFFHILSIFLLIPGDISTLINFLSFITSFVMLFTTIALIRLRRKIKPDPNAFRTPLIVPILSILFCIFTIVTPFLSNPRIEFLYGLGLVAIGCVLYVPFVHFKLSLPGMDKLTTFLQVFAEVAPTAKLAD